eukprot:5378640-Prymnesium_polylepis.2
MTEIIAQKHCRSGVSIAPQVVMKIIAILRNSSAISQYQSSGMKREHVGVVCRDANLIHKDAKSSQHSVTDVLALPTDCGRIRSEELFAASIFGANEHLERVGCTGVEVEVQPTVPHQMLRREPSVGGEARKDPNEYEVDQADGRIQQGKQQLKAPAIMPIEERHSLKHPGNAGRPADLNLLVEAQELDVRHGGVGRLDFVPDQVLEEREPDEGEDKGDQEIDSPITLLAVLALAEARSVTDVAQRAQRRAVQIAVVAGIRRVSHVPPDALLNITTAGARASAIHVVDALCVVVAFVKLRQHRDKLTRAVRLLAVEHIELQLAITTLCKRRVVSADTASSIRASGAKSRQVKETSDARALRDVGRALLCAHNGRTVLDVCKVHLRIWRARVPLPQDGLAQARNGRVEACWSVFAYQIARLERLELSGLARTAEGHQGRAHHLNLALGTDERLGGAVGWGRRMVVARPRDSVPRYRAELSAQRDGTRKNCVQVWPIRNPIVQHVCDRALRTVARRIELHVAGRATELDQPEHGRHLLSISRIDDLRHGDGKGNNTIIHVASNVPSFAGEDRGVIGGIEKRVVALGCVTRGPVGQKASESISGFGRSVEVEHTVEQLSGLLLRLAVSRPRGERGARTRCVRTDPRIPWPPDPHLPAVLHDLWKILIPCNNHDDVHHLICQALTRSPVGRWRVGGI